LRAIVSKDGSTLGVGGHPSRRPLANASGLLRMTPRLLHERRRFVPGYCTSWIRLIMSAYFGPYLSHTGFTASWNGFLSGTSMI
jgi:hypothetical protein